ncbi:hypothetical protein NZK35_00485 [Stieleria sp. ICT_E10.1]|uniref:hypothetical protein n=1 Tax=Stieleria sedimenti TaxID=2976331 RepID=UPI00217FA934|nr:hypothetical protein [Stieleria sedimenti]MCS7465146.1 hypothetical protein [Stieleria sedimenti]
MICKLVLLRIDRSHLHSVSRTAGDFNFLARVNPFARRYRSKHQFAQANLPRRF